MKGEKPSSAYSQKKRLVLEIRPRDKAEKDGNGWWEQLPFYFNFNQVTCNNCYESVNYI